ncbi:hypothetical protein AB0E63_33105 [Kribbella sp. NPDC026596]|uniref:hypothetical protein n=1 Tax=Kribbella sp. NPDC026596 TaxID=3155122 RepID=UPI003411C75F
MRQPPRRIWTKLEAGESAFGVTIQLPSPESVEIAGYTGYDFAWIDAEHGTAVASFFTAGLVAW